MRLILPLIFLCLLSPAIGRSAPLAISPEVQIEPVTSFTTFELWNATRPTSVDLGVVVVNHRMMDIEARTTRGKWTECGLVMIGNGDIATRPVAFRVWAKQACEFSTQKRSESGSQEKVQLIFFVNPAVSMPIQVSRELVVTVAGKRIGRIRAGRES